MKLMDLRDQAEAHPPCGRPLPGLQLQGPQAGSGLTSTGLASGARTAPGEDGSRGGPCRQQSLTRGRLEDTCSR